MMQMLLNRCALFGLMVAGLLFLPTVGTAGAPVPKTPPAHQIRRVDICVYSGNATGMVAAFTAAQHGKKVLVIEPSRWLGGIVGGGIRANTDCLHREDVGGWAAKIIDHNRKTLPGRHHNYQHKCREHWRNLAKKYHVPIIFHHRVDSKKSVHKTGQRITHVDFDFAPYDTDGCPAAKAKKAKTLTVYAHVFIDATYEGDLMARSGVSYTTGRESRKKYDESLAGQQNVQSFNIDPYKKPGDPNSGLIPMIDSAPFKKGAASPHFIGYNFRWQWAKPGTGHPMGKPSRYVPAEYELARRSQAVKSGFGWPTLNYNRRSAISSGVPGLQSQYPDAHWPKRAEIWRRWIDHGKIMHQISGSKRELKKVEYPDSKGQPHQLYIRLARRMIGEYIMTQHDLMYQTDITNSIGLGFYAVDVYPCRLIAHGGKVCSEGEVSTWVSPGPYPIPYEVMTPKKSECVNLLVPVCVSASHVALASMRMESTYIMMGESAAHAAVLAVDQKTDVQKIDHKKLKTMLEKAGQILRWDGEGYFFAGKPPRIFGHRQWWLEHADEYKKRPISTWKKETENDQQKKNKKKKEK